MATVHREPGPAAPILTKVIAQLDGKVGKVGWFAGNNYPDGGPPVALVAAVNEHGWPEHNIPPRLGMRATAERMQGQWAAVARSVSKRVLAGQITPDMALDIIGQKAAGDVRKNIANVTTPPLKVDTIKARLRGKNQGRVVSLTIAKPLVASGHLLNSLTNTVEKE